MGRALNTMLGNLYNTMITDIALGLILLPFRFGGAVGGDS